MHKTRTPPPHTEGTQGIPDPTPLVSELRSEINTRLDGQGTHQTRCRLLMLLKAEKLNYPSDMEETAPSCRDYNLDQNVLYPQRDQRPDSIASRQDFIKHLMFM